VFDIRHNKTEDRSSLARPASKAATMANASDSQYCEKQARKLSIHVNFAKLTKSPWPNPQQRL
jgi:hypothetical protein